MVVMMGWMVGSDAAQRLGGEPLGSRTGRDAGCAQAQVRPPELLSSAGCVQFTKGGCARPLGGGCVAGVEPSLDVIGSVCPEWPQAHVLKCAPLNGCVRCGRSQTSIAINLLVAAAAPTIYFALAPALVLIDSVVFLAAIFPGFVCVVACAYCTVVVVVVFAAVVAFFVFVII